MAEIGGADLDCAARRAGDAKADAVAEGEGDEGLRRRVFFCLLPHPDGFCGQQRFVVQRHANAAVPGCQPLEINPFVTENRRPDECCRGRIHQPLAADRDLEDIVPVNA